MGLKEVWDGVVNNYTINNGALIRVPVGSPFIMLTLKNVNSSEGLVTSDYRCLRTPFCILK